MCNDRWLLLTAALQPVFKYFKRAGSFLQFTQQEVTDRQCVWSAEHCAAMWLHGTKLLFNNMRLNEYIADLLGCFFFHVVYLSSNLLLLRIIASSSVFFLNCSWHFHFFAQITTCNVSKSVFPHSLCLFCTFYKLPNDGWKKKAAALWHFALSSTWGRLS